MSSPNLPSFCRRTKGHIPAKRIGASITVIGSKAYLFGGRVVAEQYVSNDLFVCDLDTLQWTRLDLPPEVEIPPPRFYHSADAWNGQLIIFGGIGSYQGSLPEHSFLWNDIQMFDPTSERWLRPHVLNSCSVGVQPPRGRHSHLSSVSADRLFIVGGEDANSFWIGDICVYDLARKVWVQQVPYTRHCGTYLSVAACAEQRVIIPSERQRAPHSVPEIHNPAPVLLVPLVIPHSPSLSGLTSSSPQHSNRRPQPQSSLPITTSLTYLPHSTSPTDDSPCDIFMYSNENATYIRRRLDILSPLPSNDFAVFDQSRGVADDLTPPFLKLPFGAVVGTHFIVAGTYFGPSEQFLSIWALDLLTLKWSEIDAGPNLNYGSWSKGCLWRAFNQFLLFGDCNGSISQDYSQKISSWEHVVFIDLESFGIYQPPPLELELVTQRDSLNALEEGLQADFEIICEDEQRIRCSRRLLEDRWPWFYTQISRQSRTAYPREKTASSTRLPSSRRHRRNSSDEPVVTTSCFDLGEAYAVTMALLQYFYALSLLTPLQYVPSILCRLLEIATVYEISHLRVLVKHAMHQTLSETTCEDFYDVAERCQCHSLQVRAYQFIVMQSSQRTLQPQPAAARTNAETVASSNSAYASSGPDSPSLPRSPNETIPEPQFPGHARGVSMPGMPRPPETTVSAETDPWVLVTTQQPSHESEEPRQRRASVFTKFLRFPASPSATGESSAFRPRGGGGGRHPVPKLRAPPKATEPKPFKTGEGGRRPARPKTADSRHTSPSSSFAEELGLYPSTERRGGSSSGSSAVDIHAQISPVPGRNVSVPSYLTDAPLQPGVGSPVDGLTNRLSEYTLNSSTPSGRPVVYPSSRRAIPSDLQSSVSGSSSSGSPRFTGSRRPNLPPYLPQTHMDGPLTPPHHDPPPDY